MSKQSLTKIANLDGVQFLQAFTLVAAGADTKSHRPIDGHVLVVTHTDGTIELRANKTGSSFKYTLRGQDVQRADAFTLGVNDLNKRSGPLRGPISISRLGEQLVFTSGKLQFVMQSLDPDDFATDMTPRMQFVASFASESFARYLRLASTTIDKTYYRVTGGLWFRSQPGRIILASVAAAYGGTRCEMEADIQGEPLNIVIPRDMVNAMIVGLAYAKDDQRVELLRTPEGNQLGIRIGDAFVSGQLLDGDFPDIDQFLTATIASSCSVPRTDVRDILAFIASTWTRKEVPARALFQFGKKQLRIVNPIEPSTHLDIPTTLSGEPTKIELNAKQVRSTMADLRADEVVLGITEKGYVIIRDPSDEHYIHAAMPFLGTWTQEEEETVEDVPLDEAA